MQINDSGNNDISVGGQVMRFKTKKNLPRLDKVQYKLIFKNANIANSKVIQQVISPVLDDSEDKPVVIGVNIAPKEPAAIAFFKKMTKTIEDSPDKMDEEFLSRRFLKPRLMD